MPTRCSPSAAIVPKAVARIAFGMAIQKLLVSASRTTSSPRAISNQRSEKPCPDRGRLGRGVEGEHDHDDDRQEQEGVGQGGVEAEIALDHAGPAIDPLPGGRTASAAARGLGDGRGGHRTLTSRVLRPRFTNQT